MDKSELRQTLTTLVNARCLTEDGGAFWQFIFNSRCFNDPLEDLNATHAIELWLSDQPPKPTQDNPQPKSQRTRFRENLCVETVMAGGPIHATALQRCNALVKTLQNNDQRASQSSS